MTDTTARGTGSLATALWVLVAHAGHLGCGGWTLAEPNGLLRCACGTALYEFHRIDRQHRAPPTPPRALATEGSIR